MADESSRMSGKRGVHRTVAMGRRLLRQAERDIEVARMLLQPRAYYMAAYLAHQAAEKSLKAAHWHLLGEEPAWTHDLRDSAEWVTQTAGEIPAAVELAIEQLTPLFERTRYPSGRAEEPIPADLIGEEDARVAVRSAEEIMSWTQALLLQAPGRARRKRG